MNNAKAENPWGSRKVLFATALAGLGGFGITISMANTLGAEFANFASFWAIYFVVLGSLGGIQQETARATSPFTGSLHTGSLRHLSLAVNLMVVSALLVSIFALLFGTQIFPVSPVALSTALVFGVATSMPSLVVSGMLYGYGMWNVLSTFIVLDVAIRWMLLSIASVFTRDLAFLSWMVAIPSFIALLLLLPSIRKEVGLTTKLDTTPRTAARKMMYSIVASLGASIVINGVPAVLVYVSDQSNLAFISGLVFAMTLVRAPLVVGSMAIQTLLVVKLRNSARSSATAARFGLAGLGVGMILSLTSWLFGIPILEVMSGLKMGFSPEYLAALTLTSVFTMWITVSGALSLSNSNHRHYSIGWMTAAFVTIGILFTPIDSATGVLVAFTAGPIAGLLVHLSRQVFSAKKYS